MRARLAAVVLCSLGLAAAAQPAGTPAPQEPLRVPRVETPLEVDGVLDDALWREALALPVNTEVRPGENIEAPVKTTVYLAYGPKALYVAFDCKDPDPSQIRARYSDRDDLWDDDWVVVILDTFNDGRRSFNFTCNPLGVQADGIETPNGGGTAWDAIWDSAGRIGEGGFTVEMAIPFSSLRFPKGAGELVWGFDAVRSYPRTVRHHIGAFPRDRGNNCYLCQALKIAGFAGADPGRNLEFDPTLTASYGEARRGFPDGDFAKVESEVSPGITARWSVTPNLTLNGAVNPDFSQVEADAAQLAINTRFALYYPEKRPFFLEGSDYFQVPLGIVYTRTLADPDWGVKLSGKVGKGVLGFFTVQDAVTNLIVPGTEYSSDTRLEGRSRGSAFRYRYDVGKSSTLGLLATDRRGSDYSNQVLGADAALRFTKEDTLYLNAYGSRTKYPEATALAFGQPMETFDGSALDLMYSHNTRNWEHYVHLQRFSEGFRADLGFQTQVGYSFYDLGTLRTWYNEDPHHWFNQIRAWVGWERTEDSSGLALRDVGGTFVEYSGPMQSSLFAIVYLGNQRYGGKDFDHDTLNLRGSIQLTKDLGLGVGLFYGDAVDYAGVRPATRLRVDPELQLFAGRHFQLAFGHTSERLWVPEGRLYEANLSEVRAVYQFNSRAFFRAILQNADYRFEPDLYPTPREPRFRHLLTQLLYSYKINPQTALYLGYSDNYLGDATVGLTQVDRALFFKVGYAWVM